jgi:transposase
MRGSDERSGALFSYVDLEARVPAAHPLRTIQVVVNDALRGLSPGFRDLYARIGRPSIPPEQLLRALLLQAFYSIRSERQLMERLEFDLLFRWFVGLGIDDPVWNHSTFSKNRDRLLAGDVAAEFLAQILDQPQVRRLLSSEHFSVDGSLIEAWASMKSFRLKDDPGDPPEGRNGTRDFHGTGQGLGEEVGQAHQGRQGNLLPGRSARPHRDPSGSGQRRPARVHCQGRKAECGLAAWLCSASARVVS